MARTPLADETPTLFESVRRVIDFELMDVNTCLPGIIESYDSETQKAVVQPALQRAYDQQDDTVRLVSMPPIPDVPVVQPRSGKAHIHFPLEKGDSVLLVFSQRSLDVWKNKDGVVNPDDRRKFNLSDAYAIPGGYPFVKPADVATADELEIRNDALKITVLKSGKLKIENGSGELIAQLELAFTTLGKEPMLAGAGIYTTVATFLGSLKA